MMHTLPNAGAQANAGMLSSDVLDEAANALWALALDGATTDPFAFLQNDPVLGAAMEIKQADEPDGDGPLALVPPGAGRAPDTAPTQMAESTSAMLARMRTVLYREAARLGEDGLEGKTAVDQVALIARTLEKIEQMERLIADDRARTAALNLSADERSQMRNTVRQLIMAAAERMTRERLSKGKRAGEGLATEELATEELANGELATEELANGQLAQERSGDELPLDKRHEQTNRGAENEPAPSGNVSG